MTCPGVCDTCDRNRLMAIHTILPVVGPVTHGTPLLHPAKVGHELPQWRRGRGEDRNVFLATPRTLTVSEAELVGKAVG